MTECYHICFTSHSEVMFRERADYIFGIFSLVLAALQTKSMILAFALMSDHVHIVLNSSAYSNFVSIFRNSYTRHFNKKYRRVGRLGETGYYCIKLIGTQHIVAAISYVLRNPVHHGVVKSPYEYEFSSSSCYFNKFFARKIVYEPCKISINALDKSGLLSKKSFAKIKMNCRLNQEGKIYYLDFLDVPFVENQYISGRRFCYYMTRFSFYTLINIFV